MTDEQLAEALAAVDREHNNRRTSRTDGATSRAAHFFTLTFARPALSKSSRPSSFFLPFFCDFLDSASFLAFFSASRRAFSSRAFDVSAYARQRCSPP